MKSILIIFLFFVFLSQGFTQAAKGTVKRFPLNKINHVCAEDGKLIEDGGFERSSNGFELNYSRNDIPESIIKDKSDHIWQCSKDTFWNTYYRTNGPAKPNSLKIDTSLYGQSIAYMASNIRDQSWDNPYHIVYYKYCKLTKPIKKGEFVKGGFEYIYMAETDQIIFNSGLLFTKDKPKVNDVDFVVNSPQILNKDHVTTKEKWFAVTDSFIAESDLNWVTIGIFSNKDNWEIDRSHMKNYGANIAEKVKAEAAKNLRVRIHYDNAFAYVTQKSERPVSFAVFFEQPNSILTEAQRTILKNKLNAVEKSKLASIELIGYTDDQGSEMLNKALSQKRANYIRSILDKELEGKVEIKASGKGLYNMDEDPLKQRNVTVNLVYKD